MASTELKTPTRSTQRVQTSLAEADHYSHKPTVEMLSLIGERLPPPPQKKKKKKKKGGGGGGLLIYSS